MKNCKQCNQEKEFSQFHKETRAKDGHMNICKECRLGHKPHKPIIEGLKICTKCKESKDINSYSLIKGGFRQSQCKTCRNKNLQDKRNLNPTKEALNKRRQRLKAKYNISLEDYSKLYQEQKGCCKICNTFYSKLAVDHCHETMKVRALLCNLCNTALGGFKDNSQLLLNAINYLKETNTDKS